MDSLGLFIISNNSTFLERALTHVNKLGLFDYVLTIINSKDQDKFLPLKTNCARMDFVNLGDVIEDGLIESTAKMPTDWIFRLDDDEQLDLSMSLGLRDLTLIGPRVYWFARKWLWPSPDKFIISGPWYPDPQVKFWHKNCKIIHTKQHDHTGFSGIHNIDLDKNILHFNLLWKTYEERMQRNSEYAKTANISPEEFNKGLGAFYLPENSLTVKVRDI